MNQEPTTRPDPELTRLEIALFRHSLVADLASTHLEHGDMGRELSKIARRRFRSIPGSKRTRVSIGSLRRWLNSYRRGGLEALKPGLRSDYGRSRAIPAEWVRKAVALRHDVPSRTARVLVEILSREEGYPGINIHTLDKVLRRLGKTRRQIRKPKERVRRWSAKYVNELWQGDATDGVWLPDPHNPEKKLLTTLFAWIDDVSRLVPHGEFFFDEKLPRMERTLKLAILARGLPSRSYTDNGNVYVAAQYKAALAELGIKPIHSRVRKPRGRGKIERFFQVVQNDFYPEVYKAGIQTLSELNEAFWAWKECIYHERVHSEIGQTPLQAYRAGLADVRSADPVTVARAFLWRFKRKVFANGFLSLHSNSYSVDPSWCGRTIELRCDPFDLSRIDVYQDGRPVARAQVRKLGRSHCLDLEPLVLPPPVEPSGVNFLDALRREYRRKLLAETGEISFRSVLQEKPAPEEDIS